MFTNLWQEKREIRSKDNYLASQNVGGGLKKKFCSVHHNSQDTSSPDFTRNEGQLDRSFYTKYQKIVLRTRKPFAIDKGFFHPVERYYSTKIKWLDAGAGTCGTMREIAKRGHDVYGIDVSNVCVTECGDLARSGKVFSAGLSDIPFPSDSFDLVWSTEVLEHVPLEIVRKSVEEIVRVARGDIFLTIAMKRSGFDPLPPEKPKIHLSVMPSSWWDALFMTHGCRINQPLRDMLRQKRYPKATFFPYKCNRFLIENALEVEKCKEEVWAYASCYTNYSGNLSKCSNLKGRYVTACNFEDQVSQ